MALAPFGSANSNTLFLTFPTPPSYLIHNHHHHHRTNFVFTTSRVSYAHNFFYSHKRSSVVTILCSASNKPSQIRYPFLSCQFFVLCMVMT
jgi:hypothetical protein